MSFRDAVFKRDQNKCRVCGKKSQLDAHHITDRHEMSNGGYVAENGIALCPDCHKSAETFHATGTAHPGFSPEDLYWLIGSSKEHAEVASCKLAKIKYSRMRP